MRLAVTALVALSAAAIAASPAPAAQLSATPANLQSVFAAASGGDTIALAPGSYGTFEGATKTGNVTLTRKSAGEVSIALKFDPASNITLDGLTLTDVDIGGTSRNITVRNSDIPGQVIFRTGELQNANILFDRNVHHDWDKCDSCGEGRVWLPERTGQPSGITIAHSEFRGGLSDGIQNGSNGTRIVGNLFHDLTEGTPEGVHTDAIQLYGSQNTLIRGNSFVRVPSGIMSPDGADHEVIEDNVFSGDPDGYPFIITIGSDDGSIVRHNTLADGACTFNLRCGILRIMAKQDTPASRGTVVKDNILGEVATEDGTQLGEVSHNLIRDGDLGAHGIRGLPTYTGGQSPASFAGHALAPGSLGTANASDGLNRGARFGADGPGSTPSASVRVLSRLRTVARTGKLRLRVRTMVAGRVVVSGLVRPGPRTKRAKGKHSRRLRKLRTVKLGQRPAGVRTVTVKLSRSTRRALGRSRSARLSMLITIDGVRAAQSKLKVKR